jgi:L-alanine-DL-glutamate epimerase-like enolase superfamily enzyme
MAAPTTIRALSVETLDIPLYEPFGIAGGAQDIARNLLAIVELADGTRGYGEAAPFKAFNGETQDIARAAIETARTTVEGADAREWRRIAAKLREAIGPVGSAQCAIETAILDALTRHGHLPLWAFFGGVSTSLETDMTITTGTAEQAAASARDILARGMSVIKVKVGSGDLTLDVDRVTAIAGAAAGTPLILDGNCGYSADKALQLAAICRAARMRLMIGGMVESILAMTTSACFAAGQGGFSYIDLDTPLLMAENPFEGGMIYEGGRIDLTQITAGHGVTPR